MNIPKKKGAFEEFHEFCWVAQQAMLKPDLTRSLTLQPCGARTLEQLNPLTLFFFIDLVNEKPTDSHIKILNNLRDPITILHKMQPYVHKEDPYENIH